MNDRYTLYQLLLCFNRTFMELKLNQSIFAADSSICFNRTFMELKSATR